MLRKFGRGSYLEKSAMTFIPYTSHKAKIQKGQQLNTNVKTIEDLKGNLGESLCILRMGNIPNCENPGAIKERY